MGAWVLAVVSTLAPTVQAAEPERAGLPPLQDFPALIAGNRLLVEIWHYPVIEDLRQKPTVEKLSAVKKAYGEKVRAAFRQTGWQVLWVLRETAGAERGFAYSALFLMDPQEKAPGEDLKALPGQYSAIIFADGEYREAFTNRKGVAAPEAGGYAPVPLAPEPLARFRSCPGAYWGMAGGGCNRLYKWKSGKVLDVFLATAASMYLEYCEVR
jgi:hypothetical protein